MSRTKKGKKPVGWDYWGRRPIGAGSAGTKGKRTGIKKERAVLKRDLQNEPTEPEVHPGEILTSEEADALAKEMHDLLGH